MRTKLIPERFRVRNFKRVMQGTLALWTIVAVLGFGIYFYRYLEPRQADSEAPLEQLFQAGDDLVAHALEMRESIERSNLSTAKRHAEHVVNLIEGSDGDNFGGLDSDGELEDPGDGTGLLNYLRDVERVVTESDSEELAERVRDWVKTVSSNALVVLVANDLASVETLVDDTLVLATRVKREGIVELVGSRPVKWCKSASSPLMLFRRLSPPRDGPPEEHR